MDISIKQLESDLWNAADNLRANSTLTAAEYKDPLLGLVFLRFVQNRHEDAKVKIQESLAINLTPAVNPVELNLGAFSYAA